MVRNMEIPEYQGHTNGNHLVKWFNSQKVSDLSNDNGGADVFVTSVKIGLRGLNEGQVSYGIQMDEKGKITAVNIQLRHSF